MSFRENERRLAKLERVAGVGVPLDLIGLYDPAASGEPVYTEVVISSTLERMTLAQFEARYPEGGTIIKGYAAWMWAAV